MAQAMLDSLDIKLFLQEDQVKKEIEDWCVCVCQYCGAPETVDIHDSYRNTSPFTCSLCYVTDVIQNCHNGEQISSYTNHNNQAVIISSVHAFFLPKHWSVTRICRQSFNYKKMFWIKHSFSTKHKFCFRKNVSFSKHKTMELWAITLFILFSLSG